MKAIKTHLVYNRMANILMSPLHKGAAREYVPSQMDARIMQLTQQ